MLFLRRRNDFESDSPYIIDQKKNKKYELNGWKSISKGISMQMEANVVNTRRIIIFIYCLYSCQWNKKERLITSKRKLNVK